MGATLDIREALAAVGETDQQRSMPAAPVAAESERSIERIDPIVAAIMAVGRSMAEPSGIYGDGRGLLIVGG